MEPMKAFKEPDGATPLDADEMEDLKIASITTRGELDRWEHKNIGEAMEWLERRKKLDEILTEEFIRKLHKQMLGKVWKWAGTFRQSDKNIGVSKYMIGIELRHLLDDVKYWIDNKSFPEDEIAVRFHHRLVLIHPFPNGNGRHSRMMADLLIENVLNKESFTWGAGDLTHTGDVRDRYLQALRKADKGDHRDLIAFARS